MRLLGRHLPAACVLSVPVWAGQAVAEPCVGAAFQRPFPGATGAQTRHVDVPSPRFPGLWQEGWINGNRYVLYANGEASLQDGAAESTWSIFVQCDLEAGTCTETIDGAPPDAARQVAGLLGKCIVDPDQVKVPEVEPPAPPLVAPETDGWALAPTAETPVVEPNEPDPEPELDPQPEPEPVPDPEPKPEIAAAPCGLAAVSGEDYGTTLQLLLVEAGADPGPIDGLPGRKTREALAQVLGADAGELAVRAAIDALDEFLCRPPE